MADPISVIGAVGAICNIIDVVGKVTLAVNDLREKWKDADLTFLSLASQLTALRIALTKIQEWMDSDLQVIHHQLVMDLDVSLSCCKVLVDKIDTLLSEIGRATNTPLDFNGKAKLIFGNRNLNDVQKLLERQTSALTLLLTACNCKTLADQQHLLEKPKMRKALDRAKSDSASLLVHHGTASIVSKFSDNMSKISAVFDFDQEIFSTPTYQRVLHRSWRDSLKIQRAQRRRTHNPTLGAVPEGSQQDVVDEPAKDEAVTGSGKHLNVLVFGNDPHARCQLVNMMRMTHHDDYIIQNAGVLRLAVIENLIDNAKNLIVGVMEVPEGLQPATRQACDYLWNYCLNPNPDEPLEKRVAEMIDVLLEDPRVKAIRQLELNSAFETLESSYYFFDRRQSIASPDYVPHEMDVLMARTTLTGIYDVQVPVGGHTMSLYNIVKRWETVSSRVPADITSIVYIVDITRYAAPPTTRLYANALEEDVQKFKQHLTWRLPSNCSIMLVFNKFQKFTHMIPRTSPSKHFKDYTGGENVLEVYAYILQLFRDVIPDGVASFHFKMDPYDKSIAGPLAKTILGAGQQKETINTGVVGRKADVRPVTNLVPIRWVPGLYRQRSST
ncbi:G-protein alpha subunit-domain-containing protein [Massariosphaeria phaeospora]|uniref:G-protein alpha subunit-domain-containing protein n=1 Tax=Massariosphaeria phaeospora TaxID=100035 RepID=A0A7C8MHC1_9PLEO|nr:G-protein alpha subunit-domain-containing protein [Massariosphaeria phaeospora]